MPEIRRVAELRGRSILLRDVREEDAAFILSLRLDPRKNRYLSPVADDVERQRAWIRAYHQSQGQAYFLICDLQGEPLGTVRLYDAVGDSFSWGSWILKDGAPVLAAIETTALVYTLAVQWGFRAAHFQVRRANTTVLAFHERLGASRTSETAEEVHLTFGWAQIQQFLRRNARYLPAELRLA